MVRSNFTTEECLMVVFMSHGAEEPLRTPDGTETMGKEILYATDACFKVDDLWRSFTPEKCPSLRDKPKLFFIDACRGKTVDTGFPTRGGDSVSLVHTIPHDADFLISQSTSTGRLATADGGSPYI
ncbi:unnamed protein product [Darwinula stevensoni]|uniref:Caspase family p20 domain-containing protein n=1 Tax=Darwinula stevensoni TaxID=69355 RepID=A0A7R9FRL3_9CRUS|nr:unnamed protein product [Darwinula stevensoni]CAG0901618.1 unnamed protein product [Darwinula stevensoni]